MPVPNNLSLENAKVSDVAKRLGELDPNARYRVSIRRVRSREELLAGVERVFAEQEPDPQLAGKSDDEIAAIVEEEIDAARAETKSDIRAGPCASFSTVTC